MKRHLRTIRGPQGLKGEKGLSAYGVWLKQDIPEQRTIFFRSYGQSLTYTQPKRDRPCLLARK